VKFAPFLLSPLSPPRCPCYRYRSSPGWALQPSGIGGQVAAGASCFLKGIGGFALNPAKVKRAESVNVPSRRAGCVKSLSENALRTACGSEPSVLLLVLKLELLRVAPGALKGRGPRFSALMSPVPTSWDSRARNCSQRAADLEILFLNCRFPVPSAEGREVAPEDVVGRTSVHLSASSTPCCKCEGKAVAGSWQPLLSLQLLRGPLISVPLREQRLRSGLQLWGASQRASSNSLSSRELPHCWRVLTARDEEGEAALGLERAGTEEETTRERACGNLAGIGQVRRRVQVCSSTSRYGH